MGAEDRGSQEAGVLVGFSGTGMVACIIIPPSCDETGMSHLYILGAIQVPGFTFLFLSLFRKEVRTQGTCCVILFPESYFLIPFKHCKAFYYLARPPFIQSVPMLMEIFVWFSILLLQACLFSFNLESLYDFTCLVDS